MPGTSVGAGIVDVDIACASIAGVGEEISDISGRGVGMDRRVLGARVEHPVAAALVNEQVPVAGLPDMADNADSRGYRPALEGFRGRIEAH